MSFTNLQQKYHGTIHFIGIGGIGMSAIAMVLHKIGIKVQGSDLKRNRNIDRLECEDVQCFIGHDGQNIGDDVQLAVQTSIIQDDNPEIVTAQRKGVKIIRRADLLAEILAEKKGITTAGTHGKTSSAAMIGVLLKSAGLDPTIINGGVINDFGSNENLGQGDFLVAESDESDGSFVDLPSFIGCIGNIEPEHLDFYGGDFEIVKNHYLKYAQQIPANGLLALCIDDDEVVQIYEKIKDKQQNILTLSADGNEADVMAQNIRCNQGGLQFDVAIKNAENELKITDIKLAAYGVFNVKNALSAVAIGHFLGLSSEQIKQGLGQYSGVKRRFTMVGKVGGVAIVDDYAHHPTEIMVLLQTARNILKSAHNNGSTRRGKLIAVFQPHKYSRTQDCFTDFCYSFFAADMVIVADIFAAGQQPIKGATQDDLVDGLKYVGHKNILKLEKEADLPRMIKENAQDGDMVICAGAGSITNWAAKLAKEIEKLS